MARIMRPLGALALALALALASLSAAEAGSGAPAAAGGRSADPPTVVVAVDVGTESLRAAVVDAQGHVLSTASAPHETSFPAPGHAEQSPEAWWSGLGTAVRRAVEASGVPAAHVRAMCVATTSCTVLACDADMRPLRPALLWMDARSSEQAASILKEGRGDPALDVNSAGRGPLSAEWMLPKAAWLKAHEPELWARAAVVCECQDWLQYRLTGEVAAGGCNVVTRWHCDGRAAVAPAPPGQPFGGRPSSLLRAVGLSELEHKWPRRCVALGDDAGGLTAEAAAHVGLPPGTRVAQGGADAFVALIGLGAATTPGAVGVVTGSSHLHLAAAPLPAGAQPTRAPGVWGGYAGAPLPHLAMVEGGQSSTGALLQWARRLISGTAGLDPDSAGAEAGCLAPFSQLDGAAAALPVGAEGLVALETLQGARTPTTDADARGALLGLSLAHSKAHVWRACCEAVCLGTRACVDALARATGARPSVLLLAGGATRSDFWLQMHADATGLPVCVGECADAPLLGSAVLAVALARRHAHAPRRADGGAAGAAAEREASIVAAVRDMVRPARTIEPTPEAARAYDALYARVYSHIAPTIAPLSHRLVRPPTERTVQLLARAGRAAAGRTPALPSGRAAVVAPSVLAADGGELAAAARDAAATRAAWLHVDVCDGSDVCSGALSSLGPESVRALREAAGPELSLDVHLCCAQPLRHVRAIADAGASRITFQWEAVPSHEEAAAVARAIADVGCEAAVSLAPDTPAAAVRSLVDAGLVSSVNVLAVRPGIGGQQHQPEVLAKIRALRDAHPGLAWLITDGGVTAANAPAACRAGANVLIAGTHLYGRPGDRPAFDEFAARVDELLGALLEHAE